MRPETYQPNFQLALLANDRGDFADARTRLERAIKANPDEVEPHVVLARLYYRLHLKPEGKREQDTIARLTASKQLESTKQLESNTRGQTAVIVPQP